MPEWKLISAEEAKSDWNKNLSQFVDSTVFQTLEWGTHKSKEGWSAQYYYLMKKKNVVGMAMAQVKRIPMNSAFVWMPGGPCVIKKGGTDYFANIKDLVELVKGQYKNAVVRFHSHFANEPEYSYTLSKSYYRPAVPMNSGFSVAMDLKESDEDFIASFKKKHRYYYKQALAFELDWEFGFSEKLLKDMFILMDEMNQAKSLNTVAGYGYDSIKKLQESMGENLSILVGYKDGAPVTSCLVLTFHTKSFYLLAAAGAKGREMSASYAQIGELGNRLREKGINFLDFGGVNPFDPKCAGVDHFKMGFGGKLHQDLGEWESATSTWFKMLLELYLKLRS